MPELALDLVSGASVDGIDAALVVPGAIYLARLIMGTRQ
jgi:hypothetical protein